MPVRTPKMRVGTVGAGQEVAGFSLHSEGGTCGLDGDTVGVGWGEEPTALQGFGPKSRAGR